MKKVGILSFLKGLVVPSLVVLLFAACAAATGPSSGEGGPHVYVAGTIPLTVGTQACYWVDGVRTDLPGDGGFAYGIAVLNGQVYVVGKYGNPDQACLWINGVRQNLDGGQRATAITIVGSTVYIAGVKSGNPYGTACVWINGTRADVETSPTAYSGATGIAVSGDTIYLSGEFSDADYYKAALWTRSLSGGTWTKRILHDDNYQYSGALGISVQNGTIAVVGYQYHASDGKKLPFRWSGTNPAALTATTLPMPNAYTTNDPYGHAYGVTLYNNQSYTAGFYKVSDGGSSYYYRASLWAGTGDPATYAPADSNDSAAFDVCIYNGDTYVVGNIVKPKSPDGIYVQPCYWKNGMRVELTAPEGGNDVSDYDGVGAHAIVVQ